MEHDYLWDVPAFQHQAIGLPRKNFLGENVFYNNWIKLLTDNPDMSEPDNQRFANILGSYGHEINERVATVAATFISWLGTNLGYSYRHEAQKMVALVPHHKPHAYLMTWAVHNVRQNGVSAGRRQLESSLQEPSSDPHDHHNRAPVISSQDYEVVEHLVLWLGTSEGQEFLKKCEEDVKRGQQEHDFRTYLEGLKLQEHQIRQVLRMARDYNPDDAK